MVCTLPHSLSKVISSPKNCSLQSNGIHFLLNQKGCALLIVISGFFSCYSQIIGNFVKNGSFEDLYTCNNFSHSLEEARGWLSIDSGSFGAVYRNKCNATAPKNANTFQFPRTGNGYILSTYYYDNITRGYQKNRLKSQLETGKKYCVKFYVNIANTSPWGIDGFGALFSDASIDTISKCTNPLTYLNPQVKNPMGNVIKDTLLWVPISGTFVATGNEKYLLLGNFIADNAVSTFPLYGPYYPDKWCDVCIDDVSCIEMDLPAYAGLDKSIIPGDSTFIGREPDFAIDPGCVWYRLPSMTPLDTISGMWVKPVVTTTYVVRQELDCSSTKWDTVVVYMDLVGNIEPERFNEQVKIYPSPADNELLLECSLLNKEEHLSVKLLNSVGECIKEENITFTNTHASLFTRDLTSGVYSLVLSRKDGLHTVKRFVVLH
jgi:hypothetical protein